jgi:UDP-glucose:(heptosyl)LPS alpha-1,3-glucosyltransferase
VKIALVILHADPSRGGAERYTVDLAAALVARGHQVSLVASTLAGNTTAEQVVLPVSSATRRGQYLKFLDAVDRHLDARKYDIVHAMLPVRRCDLYHPHAGLAAQAIISGHEKYNGLRKSLAAVANRFNRKRQTFASVERELLSGDQTPVVLCLSNYVKSTVQSHYDLPAEKLATLFNAVDLKKFDPMVRPEARAATRERLGIGPDRVAALIIAQDFQRKGLAEAINAMTDDSRLVLVVVGKQDIAPYVRLRNERGLADRVIFAGPTSDPYSFYAAADLFVLPTRHDPCSLVVLEAMAMGKPVISTVFNGACEIMTEGVHGYVLPDPRDVEALKRCYSRLLDDPARQKMSAACIELRPRLSQDQHVDRLLSIYETAI